MYRIFYIIIFCFTVFSAQAGVFRFVVAKDGTGTHTTVQEAINACPDNERSIIFIKNGIYNEQVSIGTSTAASLKKISLIGENADSVIITGSRARNSANGLTYLQVVTFQVYAQDFYAENMTIENTAGNTGQAEALYTGADRQTFKNVKLRSYQDTYRSKKGTRGYFKNCLIEGAVDFIYAGGVLLFDDCEIRNIAPGYITAPEDAAYTIPKANTVSGKFLRVGFVFRNCSITASEGVADNSCYLGRPWNQMAGSFYINCRLGKHIHSKGWKEWNGNETSSSFAELNSMNAYGNAADISQRVAWSFQLPQADYENFFADMKTFGVVTSSVYKPDEICIAPPAPSNIVVTGNTISWSTAENVTGYIIFKNNRCIGITAENTFTENTGTAGTYVIKSVGLLGQLSDCAFPTKTKAKTVSEIKIIRQSRESIYFSVPVKTAVYNTGGQMLSKSSNFTQTMNTMGFANGIYTLYIEDEKGSSLIQKLLIN